jgi:hypothetical protein
VIFAWDETNRNHIAKHGVTPTESRFVVENATAPFPQDVGDGKRRVWGPTVAGRLLQVIYVLKAQDDVAFESIDPLDWEALQGVPEAKIARVIHAMELTTDMKRQLRRRRR